MIKRIISVRIVRHWDACQTTAYVDFILDSGRRGFVSGDPNSLHMAALIARAVTEGVHVTWDNIAPYSERRSLDDCSGESEI